MTHDLEPILHCSGGPYPSKGGVKDINDPLAQNADRMMVRRRVGLVTGGFLPMADG